MGLPSQRSDDDSVLVDEIIRSIDAAEDPKRVRSLLNAWWRYAGVRAAAGAEVDAEKFLAERSSLGLLELPVATSRAVIELEFAIANGPQGPLPVVVAPELTPPPPARPVAVVRPAPTPEPAVVPEPVDEVAEAAGETAEPPVAVDASVVAVQQEGPYEPEAVAQPAADPEPEIVVEAPPVLEVVAVATPEPEPPAEAEPAAEPEPHVDEEPEAASQAAPEVEEAPAAAPVTPADDRIQDDDPVAPVLALLPEPEAEPDAGLQPDAGVAHEALTPIPVAALLRGHDVGDAPEEWEALDEPVPITHFERFRRDRVDRTVESTERAKLAVYAGLIVFFALTVGIAMAASLVITHVSLPVPGSDAVAVVAPWRAWLAIVAGLAGVVVATVIARRKGLEQVLFGPRIGLGGLAVTGIGLLAGSVVAAAAGGVVLLGGAALGAVRRA